MKPLIKAGVWIAAFVTLVGLYFASNIYGYYRFKSICAKEGGLKVYQPLQKSVGWLIEKNSGGGDPLSMYSASYTRFKKDDGSFYDMTMKMPIKEPYFEKDFDKYFEVNVSDISKQPAYELRQIYGAVPDGIRLSRHTIEVIEIATGKTLVAYQQFGYESFERKNTLLDAPSSSTCPKYANFGPNDSNQQTTPGELYLGIQSAVK